MLIHTSRSNKSKQINLIPQDEFETSNFGRILKWALSTFRIVVIITELIVMSAFLSRFWLDAKNSDLNEEINNSKAQILAYKNIETEFRSLQQQTAIAKALYLEPKISSIITTISSSIPNDIVVSSISDTNNELAIKASSLSERSIAQMLVNLQSTSELKEVSLIQANSNFDNNATTVFTVSAKIVNSQERREQ